MTPAARLATAMVFLSTSAHAIGMCEELRDSTAVIGVAGPLVALRRVEGVCLNVTEDGGNREEELNLPYVVVRDASGEAVATFAESTDADVLKELGKHLDGPVQPQSALAPYLAAGGFREGIPLSKPSPAGCKISHSRVAKRGKVKRGDPKPYTLQLRVSKGKKTLATFSLGEGEDYELSSVASEVRGYWFGPLGDDVGGGLLVVFETVDTSGYQEPPEDPDEPRQLETHPTERFAFVSKVVLKTCFAE